MPVVFHEYDLPGFRAYLEGYRARGAVLRATFLHHTWSPTPADWCGLATMEGIRRAHRARGFSDIACHAYASPDGTVFNARPPGVANCACQYPDEAASTWPPELRRLSDGDPQWMNRYGFGVETVGNFDVEDPTTSVAMRTALDVLAMVHDIWNIPVEHSFLHRDVSSKSCPGSRVRRDWVHAELQRRLTMETPTVEYDAWAAEGVQWAQRTRVMVGRGEEGFAGREPVTRQELAVTLYRLYRLLATEPGE